MGNSVRIAGYAAVYHAPDLSGDRIASDAFSKTLLGREPSSIKMLWNHDPSLVVGNWTSIRAAAFGLLVTGDLDLEHEQVDELLVGNRRGLSIGYHTVRAEPNAGGHGRWLAEIALQEISLVEFPMQTEAVFEVLSDVAGVAA
ncbi:MAG: HK97 family phage prohead protease [Pseudomonadota bacterium]